MSNDRTTTEIEVSGMSCEHCVAAVEAAAKSVAGVTSARVDLKSGMVEVEGTGFERQKVLDAIAKAGYEAA
jgi:copper chaperone